MNTTFSVTFTIGKGRKKHVISGVWSFDLKNKTMWMFSNEADGAYYIENVTHINAVSSDSKALKAIEVSDNKTRKLIHLL